MKIKERIRKWLGIEQRILRLEGLECWSLRDVADKLSDSYVILGSEYQILSDTIIEVPPDKKGVLLLGKNQSVIGCYIKSEFIENNEESK